MLSTFSLLLVLVVVAFSVRIVIVFNRNEIISRLAGTPENKLTFDRHLIMPLVTYVVIPVLTVLAFQFPQIGGLFFSLVEGLRGVGSG